MRLVSALLFVALTGSLAVADEVKPPDPKPEVARTKVPLRVVRMLTETKQVLLFDKNRGTHVVAELGQDVDGYIVDEIAGDEVTLIAPNGSEVILAAPDLTWRREAAERKAAAVKLANAAAAPGAAASPPVASPPAASPPAPGAEAVPADPYGDPAEVAPPAPGPARPASAPTPAQAAPAPQAPAPQTATAAPQAATGAAPAAPAQELDPGIAAFVEAVGAAPASPAPAPAAPPVAAAPPPAVTAAPAPVAAPPAPVVQPPAAPPANSFTLARTEVDTALSDFGATAVTFDAKFVPEGLRIDSIADGTLLAKAGLRKGDTIIGVDGRPLRSFDDAADLYGRLGTARTATIALIRAGKPMTVHVSIR